MPSAVVAVVGILGLCIGSFLNVVAYRVPLGRSVVGGRSACPSCAHLIAWYDDVPVVSWLVLRGRCRHCAAPISARYPARELITGVLFALAAWQIASVGALIMALVLIAGAIAADGVRRGNRANRVT